MRQNLLFICLSFLFADYSFATKDKISPFNGLKIDSDSTSYTFFVSGHFYGSDKNQSGFPANTLLGNLDWINDQEPLMMISLGDLFKDVNTNISNYERSFFSKIDCPLFNAVGNHDISGTKYQDEFGETSFSFEVGNDLHIILDSEENNGDLSASQIELIEKANRTGVRYSNVFIYSHRTLWKESYSELDDFFNDNTQSLTSNNFRDEVKPLIQELSEESNVYWMSGSMGPAPASFFYFEKNDITYIATAIRELPRDAILKVKVNGEKTSFETCSLTGQSLLELESYNIDYWSEDHSDEEFNLGLFAYKIQLMLTHRYFWYGVMWSVFGFGIILLFIKRRKKPKTS